MTSLCVSLMEERVEDFLKVAQGIEADLIEVRADGLGECTPEAVHHLLAGLKKAASARIILTVRSRAEGGRFNGSEEERKKIILGNIHLADMVDIELRSAMRDEVVQKARANNLKVIISYHDFDKTPGFEEMERIIEEEVSAGADYAKVAFMANTLHDVLTLLQVTEQMAKKTSVIAISMGETGMISRIAAPVFGSSVAYVKAGRKTAPGQLSLGDTRKVLSLLGVRS